VLKIFSAILWAVWNGLQRTGIFGGRVRHKAQDEKWAKKLKNVMQPDVISRRPVLAELFLTIWIELQRSGIFGGRIRHKAKEVKKSLLPEVPNGIFIQLVYELFLQRGALANEIVSWDHFLGKSLLRREVFVVELVRRCLRSMGNRLEHSTKNANEHPPISIPGSFLGNNSYFTIQDWRKRECEIKNRTKAAVLKRKSYSRFPLVSEPAVLVTAIASLYKGGCHISRFMENITSQSIFRDYCELIIVDANSPENEFDVIKPYLDRFPNIKYFRAQDRIGIYEAWNLAI
jgi:hypothetical protein